MKTFLTLLLCLAFFALKAQGLSQDTLINENFEENPTSEMLLFPSGNDPQWVNYDADQISGSCVAPPTPRLSAGSGTGPSTFWNPSRPTMMPLPVALFWLMLPKKIRTG